MQTARGKGSIIGLLGGIATSLLMAAALWPVAAHADENSSTFDAVAHVGSLWWLGEATGAHDLWRMGITGDGVDVALIDSGVVPVTGLDDETRVLHGPDFSLEADIDDLRHLDTFGHGTHLAGIIGANDGPVDPDDPDRIQGLAPESRLVSIKVAEQRGVTELTSVLAAIDWVIENRDQHGLNIRVLNLAFVTDSPLDASLDPLSYAVERAWNAGIVVVVAAGNGGNETSAMAQPAANPYVISVGAQDQHGTPGMADDTVAPYSSRGSWLRTPDVVAPGSNIVSLRNPGSYLDGTYPAARFGGRFFRGSGSSQATAVVSGLAALVVDQHPTYGPDQVKAVLEETAERLADTSRRLQGDGAVDGGAAANFDLPFPSLATQVHTPALGTGSLDAARGSLQVLDDTQDTAESILGTVADPVTSTIDSTLGLLGLDPVASPTWTTSEEAIDGTFVGNRWAGDGWAGNRWADDDWAGNRWAGNRWAGDGWTGNRWATGDWSANRWATASWD